MNKIIFVILGIVFLLSGFFLVDYHGYQRRNPVQLGLIFIYLVTALWWLTHDAAQHDFTMGRLFKIAFLLLPVVMVPVYLSKTRKEKFFRSLGLFVLLCFVLIGLSIVGGILALSINAHTG